MNSNPSIDATVDETTRDESSRGAGRATSPGRMALQILWSRQEPWRVGEIAFAPRTSKDAPVIVGRGVSPAELGTVRASWIQQRPGSNQSRPALNAKSISRDQLRVSVGADGVALSNMGRCPLFVDGREVQEATLGEGQLARLGEQLLFIATRRPLRMQPLRDAESGAFEFGGPDRFGLVGESLLMWELRDRLAFVAHRDLHVLILGPTGSGKELATRAIHGQSSRADRALVSRSAATIPSGLMDAELFGNVRDYPNPGMKAREGLIGQAHGSTLFLDEIGEIPTELQAHLLRVLDADGEYQRLGEDRSRNADLRIIAATNRSVEELKHDLVPRLALRLTMPDLADHHEDIPHLVQHLLRTHSVKDPDLVGRFAELHDGTPWFRVAPSLVEGLYQRRYPHQVRGLVALLWQCLQSSPGRWIELAPDLAKPPGRETSATASVDPDELDRETILQALEQHGWVIKDVWPALGLRSRHQLRRLMKKHDLRSA